MRTGTGVRTQEQDLKGTFANQLGHQTEGSWTGLCQVAVAVFHRWTSVSPPSQDPGYFFFFDGFLVHKCLSSPV